MIYSAPQTQHALLRHLAAFVPVKKKKKIPLFFFPYFPNDPQKSFILLHFVFFLPSFTRSSSSQLEASLWGRWEFFSNFLPTSSALNGNYRGRRRGRRGAREDRRRNVRWICEDVSDTPAYYHANCTVNVIIGTTNLAGSNYRGGRQIISGAFLSHEIVFNVPLLPFFFFFMNAKQ